MKPPPVRSGLLGGIQAHPTKFLLVVFVAVTASLTLALGGRLGVPPPRGDGVVYDNIAFNLARGQGFSVDWDNAEWRRPYERHNSDHGYDYLLSRSGRWRTAGRPPMLPLLMAGNQLLFGRQFVTVRVSNALFIAGALCLAAALAMRLVGPLGAVLVPILGFADRHALLHHSGAIMTESLGLFAVVLLTWLLARLLERPTAHNAALAGAALGFALLCRSIFFLWYPLLVVAVFLLDGHAQASGKTRCALAAHFLVAAVAVPAPWWTRNCIVLDAFMPLGTQGGMALAGGYNDVVWKSGTGGFIDFFEGSSAFRELPGHLRERELAKLGTQHALEWIKRNPEKIPVLAWRRLRGLIGPRSGHETALLLVLAVGGLLSTRRRPLAHLLAGLVVINAVAIMATYSPNARYLFPVRGSLYALAAVGLVRVGGWLLTRRRPRFDPLGSSAEP